MFKIELKKVPVTYLLWAYVTVWATISFISYASLAHLSRQYSLERSWSIFQETAQMAMPPLMIIVTTATVMMLMAYEYDSGMWRYLTLFPIRKGAVLTAKLLTTFAVLSGAGISIFFAVVMASFAAGVTNTKGVFFITAGPVLLAFPLMIFLLWTVAASGNMLTPTLTGIALFLFIHIFAGWGVWLPWGPLATFGSMLQSSQQDLISAALALVLTSVLYFVISVMDVTNRL
ncbi:ABC transporter permease [Salipaludibacillus sp. LMS25]|uniref:ABC transporter permease n=1 Tax=Salipaludibacillus sp. LMS25 TaxID=2924031 RepID=UPI0020D1D9E2|nr:ABC transporter permease [Salipaludibacillus sp. LMS25]UTR13642.1 ABC transporter permease [Salipaludibacillus sp. LMS25]